MPASTPTKSPSAPAPGVPSTTLYIMALGRGAYEGSAGPFRYRIEATGQGRFAARVIRRGRTIAQASQFSTVVGAKGWCQHQHVMRSIGR